jgi:DNA-binding XRE family transcriptional regulator
MPDIARVLKEEITRLARRETKAQADKLKKASLQHQRDIAALKRQVRALERQLASLERRPATVPAAPPDEGATPRVRFAPKGLKAQRDRLGLSAADYAKLLGVSGQTIHNWERGATTPRQEQKAKLAELRGIGKREVKARLAATG